MTQKSILPILVLALSVVTLAGILAACATTGVNRGDLNLISIDEEWQLGNKLEQDIAQQMTLVDDRASNSYIDQVGQRLVRQTEMAGLPWDFHIVANPEINAFNIPGGHVYVNTGLIAATGDVAELAGVMAHEVAHGVSRHGTERLTKSQGLSYLLGSALGEDPESYQQILAQVVGGGVMAKFSRDDEREADSLGVHYMAAARYNPTGMAEMFETLLQQRQQRPGAVSKFFSSHPVTEERIAAVRAEIRGMDLDLNRLTTRDPDYQRVRTRISRYNH